MHFRFQRHVRTFSSIARLDTTTTQVGEREREREREKGGGGGREGRGCQPKALARGLLNNTTLTKVTVLDSEERDSIMAALEDLRREGGHTQKPDPEVARCGQVLRYVCDHHSLSSGLILLVFTSFFPVPFFVLIPS